MAQAPSTARRFESGRVIRHTFQLFTGNFAPFFTIALVFYGLPTFVAFYLEEALASGNIRLVVIFGGALISWITGNVLIGILTEASIARLSNRNVDLGRALLKGVRLLPALTLLGILTGIGLTLGFILLIIPGLLLLTGWLVATPALVVERLSALNAIDRSEKLTEGSRWQVFGMILLFAIPVVLFEFAGLNIYNIIYDTGFYPNVVYSALLSVIYTVQTLISTIGIAAIYFELRRIKEGLGVTDLASVFD